MSKKLILATALVTGFASSALGSNPILTLSGTIDTQYGFNFEKSEFRTERPLASQGEGGPFPPVYLRQHALVNSTKIVLRVDGQTDYGHKYGGLIKLNADTSSDKFGDNYNAKQTMAYFEGKFGRFEAGSYTGASHALSINTEHLAKGTGGVHGDWWLWINPLDGNNNYVSGTSGGFMPLATLYTNNISLVGAKSVNASKLNYFTPVFHGWSAGVSYVPDLESYGTISEAGSITKATSGTYGMYRDIFEGGIHYAGKMNYFGFKAGLVGQTGTGKAVYSTPYARLKAWEVGAALKYINITFAAAYGDHDKSGQPRDTVGPRSRYWNAGVSYEQGPFGLSLTHANTKRGINDSNGSGRFKITALGGDYYLARGIKLYGDIAYFKEERKGIPLKNKGTLLLIGSKLNF